MTDLSPVAQAVLDAAYREMDYAPRRHVQWVTAAALRAVVQELKYFGITEKNILAIAAELEGTND
jgi:hypothetical protein